MRKAAFLLLILFTSLKVAANTYDIYNIYNAYFNLKYLGGNIYELKLNVELDRNGEYFYKNQTKVGIYDKANNRLISQLTLKLGNIYSIPTDLKCVKTIPNYDSQFFSTILTIDSAFMANHYSSAGYYFYWETCCLSPEFINAYKPSEQSVSAYLEIPPFFSSKNDTDRFVNSSPIILKRMNSSFCVGIESTINLEHYDPDNDSLVYKFTEPYSGTYTAPQYVGPTFGPKPYLTINWNTNYSLNKFIDLKKPIELNSQNGEITILPNKVGKYIGGLSIEEYRKGIKIGVTYKNLIFDFFKCPVYFTDTLKYPDVSLGETAKFKVYISEINAKYQWQQNVGSSYINLENQKSDSLLITITDSSFMNNKYRCWVIANTCGIFSNDAHINLVEKLGINEHSESKQITIHPNPSNTIVTVSGVDEPIKVSLYSLEGKLLKEIYHSSTMDVSDILPGMYIVRVTDKNHNANYFGKLRIGE